MACRLGICEINNNRKKPSPQRKKGRAVVVQESSSDWSDSDSGTLSGCTCCELSSSSCSCSECDPGTDSSDEYCCKLVSKPKNKKKTGSARKVFKCRDGVCTLVPKKKIAKPSKPKKTPVKNIKEKKKKPAKK